MSKSGISFVTGAAGFVGGHLTKRLFENNCLVGGIGHGELSPPAASERGMSAWMNGEVTRANLDKLAQQCGLPDYIFHLAGGSSVAASMSAPCTDFEKTCCSTSELLEWVRVHSPHSKMLFVSSAAVYGNKHSSHIAEHCLLAPYSVYGVNKRIAETLFESYTENYGLNAAIVRLFSVYGPGLRKQLLWDICTKLCRNSGLLELGGTGGEMRDWIHVQDAVDVMLSAIEIASNKVQIINGGTGIGTNVDSIARLVSRAFTGKEAKIEFSGARRAGDPDYLVADIQQLRQLGKCEFRDVADGLHEFVSWYKMENSIK